MRTSLILWKANTIPMKLSFLPNVFSKQTWAQLNIVVRQPSKRFIVTCCNRFGCKSLIETLCESKQPVEGLIFVCTYTKDPCDTEDGFQVLWRIPISQLYRVQIAYIQREIVRKRDSEKWIGVGVGEGGGGRVYIDCRSKRVWDYHWQRLV